MITGCEITSGYATKLPSVAGRRFEFKPGLNAFFGPNGCGKTTVLRIAAAYAGCERRGWSSPVATATYRDNQSYPECFATIAPGKCTANVSWDGTPAFLLDLELRMTGMLSDIEEEFEEQFNAITQKPSSGQLVTSKLVGLKSLHSRQPDLTKKVQSWVIGDQEISYDGVNEVWQEYVDRFVDYLKTLKPSGRMTLFLDEPDRSLSIPNQRALWNIVLPSLAEKMQVITASHSVFALKAGDVLIEMEPGYIEASRKCLAEDLL